MRELWAHSGVYNKALQANQFVAMVTSESLADQSALSDHKVVKPVLGCSEALTVVLHEDGLKFSSDVNRQHKDGCLMAVVCQLMAAE